ncbi:lytic murein transglycosylase [Acetobacter sp. TBRC 12305]|uniref:Lytic murein transglycosylase n=1 Tax=Acetobacter garciniae TaxID=2817435 RepID=A0A939KPL7_9PROT|nr:lytic murein transglycosylase [Acetobacter garciniae]MBO1324129.1 lytic murein transglycosylase [Acetobacter garciniae]MBX0343818.1 lytic murein transglycosylase [Acetobacter garciniae]
MLRRTLLACGVAALGTSAGVVPGGTTAVARPLSPHPKADGGYAAFLAGVRRQAVAQGLSATLVARALALSPRPNAKVLQADRHQPEFTLTWAQYKDRVLTEKKLSDGLDATAQRADLLGQVSSHYGVSKGAIAGIWGLESAYGTRMGTYSVIDALATLAYDGRRATFFRAELLKALHILGEGATTPEGMLGSYAGAMGQPQFMPSAYERYAASFPAGGRGDIWHNEGDVFASIANYLARCDWQDGQPWGEEVMVPDTMDQALLGRAAVRPMAWWTEQGVRPRAGSFVGSAPEGAVIRPDGPGGEAFIVYHNFNVIRRYNPSDFYALGVGLLGDAIT